VWISRSPDRNPVVTRSRIRPSISALVSTTKTFSGAPAALGFMPIRPNSSSCFVRPIRNPAKASVTYANATLVQATSGGSRKTGTESRAATARPAIRPPTPATISAAGTLRSSSSIERTAVAVCRPSTPPRTNPVDVPRTTYARVSDGDLDTRVATV
jgi:hypothetical protein